MQTQYGCTSNTIQSGTLSYPNQVPGDTKQSKKWTSTMGSLQTSHDQEEFHKPLCQVLLYCIKVNSRYRYIFTDIEAFFFRRTKSEEPAIPLSTNCLQRQHAPPIHNRIAFIPSEISGTSVISLDFLGTPYTDAGNSDINEGPLEYAVIPQGNSGSNSLTINLGLWFIHLLAASDNAVKERYPVFGT